MAEKFTKQELTNRIDELIKKYEISLSNDGILRGNVVQAEKDNILDDIKSRKAEIIARLEETKVAEERAAAERAAKIAAIEGLEEIKRARAEVEEWDYRFARSFEGETAVGGMGVGEKPNYDFDAMYKKYPAARAYLRAEAEANRRNYELAAIGRKKMFNSE